MKKPRRPPYSWRQVEEHLQETIQLRDRYRIVSDRDNSELDKFVHPITKMTRGIASEVDIPQETMLHHCKLAYEYAYQTSFVPFRDVVAAADSVDNLLVFLPNFDAHSSPPNLEIILDSPLRRILETFMSRFFNLTDLHMHSCNPSLREISLLANISIHDVIDSMGQCGFKISGNSPTSRKTTLDYGMSPAEVRRWLSSCNDFIPQRSDTVRSERIYHVEESLYDDCLNFPDAVTELMELQGHDIGSIEGEFGVSCQWLTGLLKGKQVETDISALDTLARAFELETKEFVMAGVRHLLHCAPKR